MDDLKERTYIVPQQFRLFAAMASQHDPDDDGERIAKTSCVTVQDDGAGRLNYYVTDGRMAAILTIPKDRIPQPPEGRFPDLDAAVPKTPPLVVIRVDAKRLRAALDLADATDREYGVCEIEWRGDSVPLVIRADCDGNSPGCGLTCLLMPMTKRKES